MVGTRPGMTIYLDFNNLRHGRAYPGHPRSGRNSGDRSAQRIFPHPARYRRP
jgi:hypothetical protein